MPGQRAHLRLPPAFSALLAVTISAGCVVVPSGDFDLTGMNAIGSPRCHCDGYGSNIECGDSCGCGTPACGDDCDEACVGNSSPLHGTLSSAIAACAIPLGIVGPVANFCLPVTAIAPLEIPPPGRFHPVPTKPVFAGTATVP